MEKSGILIIEEDKQVQSLLKNSLESEGYCCLLSDRVGEGIVICKSQSPDLVFLGYRLSDMKGEKVVTELRKVTDAPVIVVSSKDSEEDKIRALDSGADDYATRQIGQGEMLARTRAFLRRYKGRGKQAFFQHEDFKIDYEKRKVLINEKEVHLTPLEYKMIELLARNAGRALTHQMIQMEVWGRDTTDDYKTLRVFMANIRRKIERNPSAPRLILTEVGVGYRFT